MKTIKTNLSVKSNYFVMEQVKNLKKNTGNIIRKEVSEALMGSILGSTFQ